MGKEGYIYFMANERNNVLYLGVTSRLLRRVAEHKAKVNKGFTSKYNCVKLVYFERFSSISDAISREKQLKNWKRKWKDSLISRHNIDWKDLSKSIGVNEKLIPDLRAYVQEVTDQFRND